MADEPRPRGRGVLYLVLSIVPFVNLFSTIGMGIAYGMKGNEVASTPVV